MKDKLILASSSPRRSVILKELGVNFEVMIPNVDELEQLDDPKQLSLINSRMKCEKISKQYIDRFVLSADTVVVLEEEIFNKPKNMDDAVSMLLELQGKTHSVYTTIILQNLSQDIHEERTSESKVTFKPLNKSQIVKYFERVDPLDKCGGYAVQKSEDILACSPTGEITNIVGLPKIITFDLLKKYNVNCFL